MEYTVDYIPEIKIVSIKVTGRVNFQMAEKYSKEAVKLARQKDCSRFLFDFIDATKHGRINRLHTAGEEFQQFGFRNTDRMALVVSSMNDYSNLLAPANQNSRWSVLKYFSANEMKNAFDWLLEIE